MNTEQRTQIQGILDQMKIIEKEIRVIEKANRKAFGRLPPNLQSKAVFKKTERTLDQLDEAAVSAHDVIYFLKKVIR